MTDNPLARRASGSRRDVLGLGAAAAALAIVETGRAAPFAAAAGGIQSLGYIIATGNDLDTWSSWAPHLYGLQPGDSSATTRSFRMDERPYRLVIDRTLQQPVFGWEVVDGLALDAVAARLEAGGVRVARGSRALALQRGVRDLVTLRDPVGNGIEIFHGAALAGTPFRPARSIGGFRTGPLGMGHFALEVAPADFARMSSFYKDLLGFRRSDYSQANGVPFIEFLHTNPREHSIVLIASGKNKIQHVMIEMVFMDDVGRAYDIALKEHYNAIALMLGKHINDMMTSFYVETPSDFQMECGWGGLLIDPDNWQAGELVATRSIWGHQMMRNGKPIDDSFLPPARETALRAPVQVYGENFAVNQRPRIASEVLVTEPR